MIECNNYIKDIVKGDTFTGLKMTFYDGEGVDKTPKDLTGYSVIMNFKKGVGQSNAFIFSTADGSITIPNPTNGEIFMQPREMNYPAYNYIFDIQLISGSNVKKTYFTNYWKIIQDV